MPSFDPHPWRPPLAPGLVEEFAANELLARSELWPTGGQGPEDVVVDGQGRLYTGLLDGTILRFDRGGGDPRTVASSPGRPLGLELDGDGDLVVCDAHAGLLRIATKTGTSDVLATGFEGEEFRLTNNAAIAADGTIYFTVSSRRYDIEHYKLDLLEHSGTGRLFARHTDGELELLADGLQFANGVALDATESSVFVAETGAYRINRYWLRGTRGGKLEPFADNLPGFPDNLSFGDSTLWAPLASPRQALIDSLLPRPWARHIVARLPAALHPSPLRHGIVLGFDEAGAVSHNLQDATGRVAITTGARWHDGRLFIGSLSEPTVAVLELA